jgi:hypothetical protein
VFPHGDNNRDYSIFICDDDLSHSLMGIKDKEFWDEWFVNLRLGGLSLE